ncbi:MAG: Sua5/YciO/YrdC/YwlC family protein [Phycisphaerae bacterium]|nr:Sua5/YciO/YrdC/YwlC family protein [Phycisphaerae bacterium]MDW8261086.1 Sua5/YciO/YrdC/YwlC family protein [Phycisphaerales bacterium]
MATEVVNVFSVGDYQAEIRRAAQLLRDGSLVVLPTETVYGVAAVASHPEAVRKVRALRGGDPGKPLTIHLDRPESVRNYLFQPTPLAERLIRKLWPGPVAMSFEVSPDDRATVCRKLEIRESDVFDGNRITLRCPNHTVATDVLGEVNLPVVLSVAGGDASAARQVDQFLPAIDGRVELVLDAGPTVYAKPSTILQVSSEGYSISRAGIYDERIIERLMRTTFLFVCSGNTCRSPMAEAIARKLIADRLGVPPDQIESRGYSVLSAGSSAFPGGKATPEAAEAVKEFGADLSRHRSRMLIPELINQADFIFTMSEAHRQAVIAHSPRVADKVQKLDPERDIEDPIGGDQSLYRELASQLCQLISSRLDQVLPRQP